MGASDARNSVRLRGKKDRPLPAIVRDRCSGG
jgi:hypothetical protein